MPRVCEICGGTEDSDQEPQVTDAIELLYVCDRCRRERAPEAEQEMGEAARS